MTSSGGCFSAEILWGIVTEFYAFAAPILAKSGFWVALTSAGQFILNVFDLGGAATRNRLVKAGLSSWIAVYAGIG
ncbi:MAG: hypothetical protein EBW68_06815, partial [Actinobacteria bacterium]|nr:hypothetical protein [Actinomycetota bacterium]